MNNPILKQLSQGTVVQQHQLSLSQATTIGRETTCEIALDWEKFPNVSREHLKITPPTINSNSWQVCDLDSSNGTYVNNQKLTGCQNLRGGEHIQLGIDGPEFLFESQSVSPTIPYTPTTPAGVPATVIEPKYSQPQQQYISPSPQSNGLPWKVIGGVVGVIAVLFLLTREPSPETATNPPENPSTTTENPATPPPQNTPSAASGDISVETEDFEDFFEITGEMQRINDVEITTRSGRKVKVDVVAFPIQAKSSFSSESREFIARFYDPQGNEINEPSPLIYDPKPQTWSRGRESTAGFILPSDISTLRVIEITY